MILLGIYKPHIKKRYWRFNIPIKKLLDAAGLEYGVRARLKLYIEGIGELEKNPLLKRNYIDIHIPRKYSHQIKPNKKYKIYLVNVLREIRRLERNTIIYGGGRKARIEIPQWYLKQNNIKEETIVKVKTEYNGEKHLLFGSYKGTGPHIQSLPPMKTYPTKVTVTKVEKYSLENFINDFNKLAQEETNYRNIQLEKQDRKLAIIIDEVAIEIGEYYFGTYAHYTYLIIRINGIEGFKTLRIHNYGTKIKIYYLQQTKKHKLTDHAAYMPLERITYGAGKLLISYYDPRRKKISTTHLNIFYYKRSKDNRYVDKVLKNELTKNVYTIVIKLNKTTWIKDVIPLIKKRNLYYKGQHNTGYHHCLGSIGERIFQEYLVLKGYTILKRNINSYQHGIDIVAENNGIKMAIEVKTVTESKQLNIQYKLNEAIKQAYRMIRNEQRKISKIIGCVVVMNTKEPFCTIHYKVVTHSPLSPFL